MELLNDREKVSTPEKQDRTVMKLQEVSMCSTILHPNDETNATKEVNETKATGHTIYTNFYENELHITFLSC